MQYSITEFESFYTRCFPSSMRMAMSLLHDEDDARDVVQEVFLKLWESDAPISNPEAFLVRSVRNSCLNRICSTDIRERIRLKLPLEHIDDNDDLDGRTEEVKAALDSLLSSRERQVVEKVYSEGMSYKDTAECLGVSVATVNKNIVASLRKLRNHFKTRKP